MLETEAWFQCLEELVAGENVTASADFPFKELGSERKQRYRELVPERKFKGFGQLLFTELRVILCYLELHIVETHRKVLSQRGEIFFSGGWMFNHGS